METSTKKLLALCLPVLVLTGCQTLREVANLRNVDFEIDGVTSAVLAGINLERVRSFEDLAPADYLRITSAVSRGDLPLEFVLHLGATNPASNQVAARLIELDWTLLLNDKETISGVLDQAITLTPGETRDIPIEISLDLYDFFESNARDLIELALSVTGRGGSPQEIKLRAVPVIDTIVGPIRYPEPITIISREVG